MSTPDAGWIKFARELGVVRMALRTLILLCSVAVPGANPRDRGAVPACAHDVCACRASGLTPADRHSLSSAVSYVDNLWSCALVAEAKGADTEDDLHVPAFAIWQVRAIHLASACLLPTHSASLPAHLASRHIPLRC
jgi:hypothetical protein